MRGDSLKTLLIFSWAHLWSMRKGAGAPSYHHTINYYINSPEWDVHLFTADSTNMDLSIAEAGKVHLFQENNFVEYGFSIPKIHIIFRFLKQRNYIKWAIKEVNKTIKNWDNTYVYAYEMWGVGAARKIAIEHNCPFITRFQGTAICNDKDTFINKIRRYPQYEALSTPADLVIMTDDGTFGNEVLHRLGNNSKCIFMRNGLDLYSRYKEVLQNTNVASVRDKMGISMDEKVLMMSSRLTGWKRVDRGIKALQQVLRVRNDVKLIIAGDGETRKSLEEYAIELGVEKKVIFLGSVLQNELYKYMIASDIFMSLYDLSNLGNPTFEAMLMRKPIVALNNGATSSVLCDKENCLLVDPDKQEELPELILYLINNQEECKRIAQAAYDYAEKNFYNWNERMRKEEDAIITLANM